MALSDLFPIILGATIALAGTVLVRFLDSRWRRKDKRNEYIAELEVDACVWIYPKFKLIMFYLSCEVLDFQNANKIVNENKERFWDNRLLLPPGVPEAWIGCRNAIANKNKDEAAHYAQMAFPLICKRFDIKEFP